jgi:hypothetical protein
MIFLNLLVAAASGHSQTSLHYIITVIIAAVACSFLAFLTACHSRIPITPRSYYSKIPFTYTFPFSLRSNSCRHRQIEL